MKPQSIRIENYRTFADVEIDLSNIEVAAIAGTNGSGKSTIIEAMLYALYGENRSKKVEDVIRLGADKMSVTFDYCHNGNIYRIIRKRSRSGRVDVQYQVLNGDKFIPVTGSGANDTDAKIVNDLGMDAKMFTLSSCVLQGDTAGICDMQPAKRKEALYKVYEDQLAKFAERHDIAKARVKGIDANIGILRGQRESLEKHTALKEAEEMALASTEQQLEAARKTKRIRDTELQTIQAVIAEADAKAEKVNNLVNQLTQLRKEESEFKASLDRHRADINKCDELLSGADLIRAEVERADELENHLKTIQDLQTQYRDLIQKYNDEKVSGGNSEHRIETELLRLESHLAQTCKDIEQCEKAASLLQEVPCKDTDLSKDCKLLASAREQSERLTALSESIEPLTSGIEKLKTELTGVQSATEENLKSIKAEADALAYDKNQHAKLQAEYDKVRHSRALMSDISSAETRKDAAQKSATEADRAARAKRMQILGVEKEEEEARKDCGDTTELRMTLKGRESTALLAAQEVEQFANLAAVHRERLAGIASAEESIKLIDEQIKESESERLLVATLQDAYSKNGIPALIMDAELSLIEEQANAILAYRPGDTMRLQFVTQKGTSAGISETLDIIIEDSAGERSFENWSGGEKLWISVAVRIAIGRILAQRTGASIETLILDEVCAPLDTDGETALVECVQELHRIFDCILLISHRESIRDRLPQQILVTKNNDGSRVEII